MLLTYLPLIMLSQLLLLSLLLNVFLFRQNRKLIKTNKAAEQASQERLFSSHTEKTKPNSTEDQTLFIHQPIFKAEPSAPASIINFPNLTADEPSHTLTDEVPIEAPVSIAEENSIAENKIIEPSVIPVSAIVTTEITPQSKPEPEKKSTFDDINRLLNEISQIEHKMGLKDKAEA